MGRPERAAIALMDAYACVVLADLDRVYRDHAICGFACACKRRPAGWPKSPPIHPRCSSCHEDGRMEA